MLDITSGLAPAMLALTTMVGRSMFGSGATGSRNSAPKPANASPIASSVVATGRRMKSATNSSPILPAEGRSGALVRGGLPATRADPGPSDRNRYRSPAW